TSLPKHISDFIDRQVTGTLAGVVKEWSEVHKNSTRRQKASDLVKQWIERYDISKKHRNDRRYRLQRKRCMECITNEKKKPLSQAIKLRASGFRFGQLGHDPTRHVIASLPVDCVYRICDNIIGQN